MNMSMKSLAVLGLSLVLAGCADKSEPTAPASAPPVKATTVSLPSLAAPTTSAVPAAATTLEATPPPSATAAAVGAVPQGGIVPGSANDPNVMPAGFIPAAVPRQYVIDDKVDLSALTETLRDYCMWKKSVPSDLNELVTSKYLPKLPEPPTGKKYAVNTGKLEVTLVNK